MCYSAKVVANFRKYARTYQANIAFDDFILLLEQRNAGARILLPKAVTDPFKEDADNAALRHCRELVLAFESNEAGRLEEQLFAQRQRLADAERALATRVTKKAGEERRIAGNKVAWLRGKLEELQRPASSDGLARIYPGSFCPVLVCDADGRRLVRPMRYQCRPAGRPLFYDQKFPGTYNARRDNLRGFWKAQYGTSHAIVVASAFYENVQRHRLEGRALAEAEAEENVVLEFSPGDGQLMHVACLWSHWQGEGADDLLSFAAITDEPPEEVSAAGHDRCIIPIKEENLDAWLSGTALPLTQHDALLDDRARPYYQHLLAA